MKFQGRQYDVGPDGRFLINTVLDSATAPIPLLMHWNTESANWCTQNAQVVDTEAGAYRNRLIFARSTISSPRPLSTALSVNRLKPFTCSAVIVGGMESSCRLTSTSTGAGPSW